MSIHHGGGVGVDGANNARVSVTGAGSGGTSSVDESGFVAGVSAGTPIMIEYGGQLLIVAGNAARQVLVSGTLTTSPPTATTHANTLYTVGTGSTTATAAASRVQVTLQNVGTTQIYILKGSGTASVTNFSYILQPGGTTKDGFSPILTDEVWKGNFSFASSAAGGLLAIGEDTP